MTRLALAAPLSGWVVPLAEVPDPVFAAGMAGEGVAIDPTDGVLRAPCDGEVVLLREARHALSLRAAGGVELLMHVGIDTVKLRGEGFVLAATHGLRVRTGDVLLRFDLDALARRATSLVTPLLVTGGGRVVGRAAAGSVRVGDRLFEVEASAADSTDAADAASRSDERRRRYRVPFDHGLHARPAAQIAALLRPYGAEVIVHAHGRSGDARSPIALMSLGVAGGEPVEVVARGADAEAALAAIGALLQPMAVPAATTHATARTSTEAGATPSEFRAVVAARGLALGHAARLDEAEPIVDEDGAGSAAESERLRAAVAAVKEHLETRAASIGGTQRSILAAHVELLQDPELHRRAADALRRGKSAGFAWREAVQATAAGLAALDDPHLRERAADLRDLERQVLRALAGEPLQRAPAIRAGSIVVADEVLPSQLANLAAAGIAGVCMARGGPTSHVALLSAALWIPALVEAG